MFDFKKIFGSKETSPEQPENDHGGDYAVRKNKRTDLIARILAILAAFLLWAYVASTNSTTEEQDFSLVPITYREESVLKNEYGLIVQSINIDTLNVKVEGLKTDVRALTDSDVKAYVNLGSITEAGEYTLDVYVDVPSGTTCVAQTVDKVVVSVDKPDTKHLPLTSDKVVLGGWSLEKDCFFGEITLNSQEIILEGPTLELEKVADIQVRADAIGSANASFTATASVHFIDSEGDEIIGSGVSVRGGNQLQINVSVLKKIKVDLKLQGLNGELPEDAVTLTPSQVWVTGEPSAIGNKTEWVIGSIDLAALKGNLEQSYPLSLEGVVITDEAGEPIDSVTASVEGSKLPDYDLILENIPVHQGDAVIGYVSIEVEAANAADAKLLQSMKAAHINVYLPSGGSVSSLDSMIVSFDREYLTAVDAYTLYAFKGAS